MRFHGGKSRIARPLGEYLRSRLGGRYFVEPFCGALSVTAEMTGRRVASDVSPYLFSLYTALRRGWAPPTAVTEDEFLRLRERLDPGDPMTAFAGYGCAWSGQFMKGYARGGVEGKAFAKGGSYAKTSRASLLQRFARCSDVVFARCSDVVFARRDYRELTPGPRHLVYCDPPYEGTEGFREVGAFDTPAFWQTVREWSARGALVLVSEYKAPPDFRCVWQIQTRTDLHGAGRTGRLEKLWEFNP